MFAGAIPHDCLRAEYIPSWPPDVAQPSSVVIFQSQREENFAGRHSPPKIRFSCPIDKPQQGDRIPLHPLDTLITFMSFSYPRINRYVNHSGIMPTTPKLQSIHRQ